MPTRRAYMNSGKKILIVDDEKYIVDILKFNLVKEGFETIEAYDGEQGMHMAINDNPDLMILDIMLPKIDGFEVCRRVREKSNIPIIMLTAREDEVDKVLGLELGADDYVTKPFSNRELMVRVKANLRRATIESNIPPTSSDVIKFGNLQIDTAKYEVKHNGIPVELTVREYELLKFLAQNTEQVFTREDLLEKVWGFIYTGDPRTVDVTVRRLRVKIEDDPSNPSYILMKRGVGYYFNPRG